MTFYDTLILTLTQSVSYPDTNPFSLAFWHLSLQTTNTKNSRDYFSIWRTAVVIHDGGYLRRPQVYDTELIISKYVANYSQHPIYEFPLARFCS